MPVTFLLAMRHFFQPTNIPQFNQEVADLSEDDLKCLRTYLVDEGYVITTMHIVPPPTPIKYAKDDGPLYESPVEVDEGNVVDDLTLMAV